MGKLLVVVICKLFYKDSLSRFYFESDVERGRAQGKPHLPLHGLLLLLLTTHRLTLLPLALSVDVLVATIEYLGLQRQPSKDQPWAGLRNTIY